MTAPLTTPEPLPYHSRLLQKDRLGHDIYRLRLARPEVRIDGMVDWHFTAGQYTTLALPDTPEAPRPYSIASGPQRDYLDLHIRDTGHGLSHAATQLTAGADVFLAAPQGHGLPAPALTRPLIFLAGGVGIAPIASLLDSDTAFTTPPRLYWGAETPGQLYLHDQWHALAGTGQLGYTPLITTTAAEDHWRRDLPGPALTADIPDLSGYAFYLSGPAAMIAATVPLLLHHRAEKAYIFGDGIGV